jgi:hypothetical protein
MIRSRIDEIAIGSISLVQAAITIFSKMRLHELLTMHLGKFDIKPGLRGR